MKFIIKSIINSSPKAIYNTWLSSKGHSEMTGGEANISDVTGDSFTTWDGYISGENLLLEKNKRIVQSWRTSEFEDHEPDSQIEIQLSEQGGKTVLTLIHTNLPESGEHYRAGWEEHYFQPMNAHFI